jgi:hypothetical protein
MTQDEIVARNVFKVRLFIDAWEAVDPSNSRSTPGRDFGCTGRNRW